MTRKNAAFAADLVAGLTDAVPSEPVRRTTSGAGILTGRENRLAELADGSMVTRTLELVDPDRCKMWSEHNRDYSLLSEDRCSDLIESLKAQGRQEMPAIVRRVKGDPDYDFEVICGARRHWAITWLRNNNYPDFRFLIDIRSLTDEEAFRVSDLENRARDDISDVERARDYLRALANHYAGRQKAMAERLNVTESWLSRYLDLARLPAELMSAFPAPHELRIKHVTALKPLLKPEAKKAAVLRAAIQVAEENAQAGRPAAVPDIIRRISTLAEGSGKKAAPKKSGNIRMVHSDTGVPLLQIEGKARKGLTLTLLNSARQDKEALISALRDLIENEMS